MEKEKRLEILAVAITGLLKFVLVDWLELRSFFIFTACLFWLLFIFEKRKNDPQTLKVWGFHQSHFKASSLLLLPFALIGTAAIIIYGTTFHTALVTWHILPILIFYPVWGLIQQFMILGLIGRNLKTTAWAQATDYPGILLTATLFSLVHLPNPSLVFFTFVMELVITYVYFRYKNLWSLGLFHGWMSSFFLFFIEGRDLLDELWVIFQ